jgi:hypothetical protein|nr:MAG TPA: hypothetical protein [Caudoviricetes sp.]
MMVESKSIGRISRYLWENKVKNVLFISHTETAAKAYYESIKDIVKLGGYNIKLLGCSEKSIEDVLEYDSKETIAIMCGIWYKTKLVSYNPFWKLIDSIYTIPVDEIPSIIPQSSTNNLNIKVSIDIDDKEIDKIANEAKEKLINSLKNNMRLQAL